MLGNKSLVLFKLLILCLNACQGLEDEHVTLKIMQYNVWGIPAISQYRNKRMQGLVQIIKNRNPYFDILTLNELWDEQDHNLIHQAAREAGLYMTGFKELNHWGCLGFLGPLDCSGLAIVSAYPIQQTQFIPFRDKGTVIGTFNNDFEWLSTKGIGRVRIEPIENLHIDIFATHTRAYNDDFQRRQIKQLKEEISRSVADVVILGGDLNFNPDEDSYKIIANYLTNSADGGSWPVPDTYGNPKNYFSKGATPQILDYIFYRSLASDLEVKTEKYLGYNFVMNKGGCSQECNPMGNTPHCKPICHPSQISLSDHEPIMAIIQITINHEYDNNQDQVGKLMDNSVKNRKLINILQERVEDLETMAIGLLSRQ